MKHQVRNLSVQQDINVLRGGAASDAFGPRSAALQALKEFMDAEQRKARKRATLLATVLGILLLALVGAGAWTALHVSKKAAAGAGVVQADVAEVRKEVQAIRRDAETRAETWAADLRAVQKSLAEAQDNLTGLREELATALQGAAGEPGAVSSLTALMQEVQVLRSEQLELDSRRARHAMLQKELTRRSNRCVFSSIFFRSCSTLVLFLVRQGEDVLQAQREVRDVEFHVVALAGGFQVARRLFRKTDSAARIPAGPASSRPGFPRSWRPRPCSRW
jgi:hypothetical protein